MCVYNVEGHRIDSESLKVGGTGSIPREWVVKPPPESCSLDGGLVLVLGSDIPETPDH